MKTYKERTSGILEKANRIRNRRRAVRMTACSLVIIMAVILFTPYDTNPPSTDKYASNEYYDVINKLNAFTYETPDYDNLFEEVVEDLANGMVGGGSNSMGSAPGASIPESDSSTAVDRNPVKGETYEETTDNQVTGVIEGDRIKRSDKYIYYLRQDKLTVYSIAGADSKQVGSFTIENKDSYKLAAYMREWEMFLSQDCKTITLLTSDYHPGTSTKYVVLISIDVSDPTNIKENGRTYLTGNYLTARSVEGELLLVAHYTPNRNQINFDEPSTFIPQYGTWDNLKCIDGANIVAPDELSHMGYTIVCQIDENTLEAKSTGAFLSYASEVYVSENHIYASRTYVDKTKTDDITRSCAVTEIAALRYSEEGLKHAGSVTIEGRLKDQYSMDEHENILRVVTTTSISYYREFNEGENHGMVWIDEWDTSASDASDSGTNANLYCIDLTTWKVAASVEQFAPKGETVRSVRFDKTKAYVCTAIQLSDPVFYFDLSDLNNITVKDTGTITGFSNSLVNFGDYLLGIGYGENMDTLKIELYQETPDGVASVCAYEVFPCYFSTEYKSYLIDRDNMRFGLGYTAYKENHVDCYTLLQFDGYEFVELVKEPVTGDHSLKRAVIIDGYIYMFGDNFIVKEI